MENIVKKQIIIKPLLSEKSLGFYKNLKVCTFIVDTKASKKEIENAFKNIYGIEPVSVRTTLKRNYKVNRKKVYSDKYKRTTQKKAYIDIGNSTLEIFENIS